MCSEGRAFNSVVAPTYQTLSLCPVEFASLIWCLCKMLIIDHYDDDCDDDDDDYSLTLTLFFVRLFS